MAPGLGTLMAQENELDSHLLPPKNFSNKIFGIEKNLGERKVVVGLTTEGKIHIVDAEKEVHDLPVATKVDIEYTEQIFENGNNVLAKRTDLSAKAKITLHETKVTQNRLLPAKHNVIYVVENDRLVIDAEVHLDESDEAPVLPTGKKPGKGYDLVPSAEPLTREELQILDVPLNTAILHKLFPETDLEVGDKWEVEGESAAELLGLDVLDEGGLTGKVVELSDDRLLWHMSGSITGAQSAAKIEMKVTLEGTFNLAEGVITTLKAQFHEKKSAGFIEPGHDLKVDLSVSILPQESILKDEEVQEGEGIDKKERGQAHFVSQKELASLALPLKGNSYLLLHSPVGNFAFLHDRRWHTVLDRYDMTVLRMITDGQLIGQCHVTRLPKFPKGKKLSKELFEKNIRLAQGDQLQQVVSSEVLEETGSVQVLRLVGVGHVNGLPMQWIYYHFLSDDGQQASYVFSYEPKYAGVFGVTDRIMAESFQFREKSKAAAKKTKETSS
ncbi:MAG: hypothetical protein MPJ24_00980 [Pirellulaceae bacterium]|nr:hypothetical protein [Pirellulaceae bacterium]